MSIKKALVKFSLSWSLLSKGSTGIGKYRRRWACHVVGTRGVILSVVQNVTAVGIREWKSSPRVLFDARVPNVFELTSTG